MRIDVASFECPKCGHRCTAPEDVNAIPNQMDIVGRIKLQKDDKGKAVSRSQVAKDSRKQELERRLKGNKVEIRTEGGEEVARVARSYAKVALQDATMLSESKHVVLACPECNTVLYEVYAKETGVKVRDDGEIDPS